MKLKEKIAKPLLKDEVVKKIFTSDNCREYLLRIISEAIDIPYLEIERNFQFIPNEISVNKKIKNSETDIISENATSYINIEINYKKSKASDNKNLTYIAQLMLRQTKSGEINDYKNMKKIIQINLNNYDVLGLNKFIYHNNIRNKEYNITRSDMLEIVDINIDYLSKIGYNELEESQSLMKMLYIFVCDDKEKIKELYEGDEIMKKVVKEIDNLTHELDKYLYYDKEALDKAADEERLEEIERIATERGIERGIEQGIERGIEQERLNIAYNMVKEKLSDEKIILITGISKEELMNIKKA